MRRSKVSPLASAFTLIELLVVISIIVLLLSIMTPTLFRAKELARRTQCRSNLKVLGSGMSQYCGDYVQNYPCESPTIGGYNYIGANRTTGGNPITLTGFSDGSVGGSAGVSRALYLLVLLKYASTTAFVCPSVSGHSPDTLPPSTSRYYDFENALKLSYSYQVRKQKTGGKTMYPLWMATNPALVVLADRTPISGLDGWNNLTTPTMATGGSDADGGNVKKSGQDEWNKNSFNHQQEGQLVVSVDSSIRWTDTPFCGVIDTSQTPNVADNIWTPTFGLKTAPPGDISEAVPDDIVKEEGNDSFLWP